MRFRLRTLLILLAVLPPILAVVAPPLAQQFVKEPPLVKPLSRPVLTSYYLKFTDPVIAHQVVTAKLANRPNIQFLPDRRLGALHVRSEPEDKVAIEAILNTLDRAPPPAPPATLNRP